MAERYSLWVERVGTADYRATLCRGTQLVTDAHAHLPALAVRDAVEHARYLRRIGWIREEASRG